MLTVPLELLCPQARNKPDARQIVTTKMKVRRPKDLTIKNTLPFAVYATDRQCKRFHFRCQEEVLVSCQLLYRYPTVGRIHIAFYNRWMHANELHHLGLVVRDAKRSTEFYQNV